MYRDFFKTIILTKNRVFYDYFEGKLILLRIAGSPKKNFRIEKKLKGVLTKDSGFFKTYFEGNLG